ncbi:ABC transporter ATP-binding protein [Acinetobacter rudis]|uniref:ABC transporter ATP-binding protein n=1 Tax=Acinetobacter rudis TaxID=632955 RepID=UPI00280F1415|nr:ABC transporter ATP-binding protein [Acinetobacter rudis]MDQ8952355.1 ABC transporter ATP-binding protein [Acinetobacter rudis]
MFKTFSKLLGNDCYIFYRYLVLTAVYAVLCGLSMVLLAVLLAKVLQSAYSYIEIFLLLIIICITMCWWLRRVVEQQGIKVGIAVLAGARLRLGEHVATLPVGWFNQQNKTQFNHIVNQGMMSIAQLPAHVFTPLLTSLITPVVMVIALFFYSPQLGLMSLLALPILGMVFYLTVKISSYTDASYQHNFASTSQRIVEFAQAQSIFRAFNGEGTSRRFLDQAFDTQRQSAFKLIVLSSCAAVLNTWVIQIIFAGLLLLALMALVLIPSDQLVLADVISVVIILLLLCRFIEAVTEVASYSEVLRGGAAQLASIEAIFDQHALAEGVKTQRLVDHSICFKDVYFSYDRTLPPVLEGINLNIASGSMTALIGASGAGKSTIAQLVARFYDVDQGQVLVGGIDVKQFPSAQLSSQMSQIFQDNYLFAGSIADNMRIGRADATETEMLHVLTQVGLGDLLAQLPEGLNSMVGEGGGRLSGGERQRMTIARALIKDAPILLIDEATAALDTENQAMISDLLQQLRGQKTILVIAHQLSTIVNADQIVVLKNGQITEQGTATELSQIKGDYWHFVQQSHQLQGWHIGALAAEGSS